MGLCPDCLLRAGFATATEDALPGERASGFVPPSPEELARYFPQLEILELLGRGGMGAVYKARQKELDRVVALKILPPDIGHDPAFAERFTREARALAKLNHPHIVTLYDFGQADGLFYFFMEYVDGVNLRQLLNGGRISPGEALAIVPQICEALQFAHDRGIVHRDIKPENILLGKDGRVKIADFGVAKIVGGERGESASGETPASGPEMTGIGRVLGTPRYMAPEQASHPLEVDHRADIYSLGVVFYQMLTGELPGKRIELPSKKVQIDVRLDEVVLRALEENPEHRYQQVHEVKTRLETITGDAAKPAISSGKPGDRSRLSRTMTILAFVIGGVLLTFLGIIVLLFLSYGKIRMSQEKVRTEANKTVEELAKLNIDELPTEYKTPIVIKAWPGGLFSVNSEEYDLDGLLGRLNKLAVEQAKNHLPTPITITNATGVDKSQTRVIADAYKAFGINSPEVLAGKPLPFPESRIKNPRLQFRLEASQDDKDAETFVDQSGHEIRVAKKVMINEGDVASASLEGRSDGDRIIQIRFTVDGMRKFGMLTDANKERRLAVLFDGRLLTAPVIKDAIFGPQPGTSL